ncbi:type II secretion system protein GspM [Hyphomonas sp.]|uniref:type II secretion system protein GspM n=1 Tax=Hyphomonas sp. TaxID=87 RepID=UPI003D2A1629
MMEWWEKLSQRERTLVGAATALLALIVLLQVILIPLLSSRSDAALRAEQSARTLDLMTSRGMSSLNGTNAASAAAAPMDSDARRRAILEAATRRGLAIARVQVSEDGVVTVQVDDANAEAVFAWLFELRSSAGLEASRAAINEAGPGIVRSSFEFGGQISG